MKHISLLIPVGDVSLSNIEATYKMFALVNESLNRHGKRPLFKVQLAGLSREESSGKGLFTIKPERMIENIRKTDLIIIPAVHGDMDEVLSANKQLLPWIEKQYRQGAEIAALCIGAFLLAATGLLEGKSCTTHWLLADDFAGRFPGVKLKPNKLITDEAGIYTSGGAFSSLNLILYLIEKYTGREMALFSSRIFEIDIERNSQSPFIIFKGQKAHQDNAILATQEFIEQHFREKISVDQLASRFALGRRNLERRFKKATSNTVIEYMQRVKIEAAKLSLESCGDNVNEVMYNVGYNDPKAFRITFKRITGLSPVEYRNRYNRQPAG